MYLKTLHKYESVRPSYQWGLHSILCFLISCLSIFFWYWHGSQAIKTNNECNLKEISFFLSLHPSIGEKMLIMCDLLCSSIKFTKVQSGSSCAHSFPNCKGTNFKMDNEQYTINNSSLINPLTTCKHKNIYNNNAKLMFNVWGKCPSLWIYIIWHWFQCHHHFTHILTHKQTLLAIQSQYYALIKSLHIFKNGNIVWVISFCEYMCRWKADTNIY